MSLSLAKPIVFGSFTVTSQVFHITQYSFAIVNLKPILPGHVLVSPIRPVSRLHELSPEEVSDLFLTVQRVGRMIERVFKGTSLNIAMQDGIEAGQSVPHVHTHIIPRHRADMPHTDDIYQALEGPEGDIGLHLAQVRRPAFPAVDTGDSRKPRSLSEMEREAQWLADEMAKRVD